MEKGKGLSKRPTAAMSEDLTSGKPWRGMGISQKSNPL